MPAAGAHVDVSSAELFNRWRRDDDRRARDELIERFLPLAVKLARRYTFAGEPYEDLVQVASLGLVKAVERFDPDRGFAFTSYAVPTILGELKRHFRDTGWALHVDRGAQELARKIVDAQRELTADAGHPPTVAELSRYLAISEELVLDGLQTAEAYDAVSLDAPLHSDEGVTSRLDSIGGEDDRYELVNAHAAISSAAKHLPQRDQQILFLRFGEDLTQSEIAERVGVSQMQVSRLLRTSLQRLRELTGDRTGLKPGHDRPPASGGSSPVPPASADSGLHATDEESNHPQHERDDQHDPQEMRGKAKPAEHGEDQQKHD